jgi:oligoendopeptidase F
MEFPVRSLCIGLALPFALQAQVPMTTIPDYSQTPRAQVPEALTWKVSDLFRDEAAWRTELEAVRKLVAGVPGLAKGWTATPKAMAVLLERISEVERRGTRLHSYTARLSDTDMGNSHFQELGGEVQSLLVGFGAQVAFVESDVLKLGRAKVAAHLRAEKRLAPYRFQLEKILRQAQHVLPEGEQKVASLTGHFAGTPGKASGLLNNLDLPRPELRLADGSTVRLNQANYQKYRAAKLPEDRRAVMAAYWTGQKGFENTFAALQDGSVKAHHFEAQIRKYPDCLNAALDPNAIDPAVYTGLVKAVRANLAPMHRLLKLRQRLLGLPEFRYGDIYASAVASVDKKYSFAEAQKLVLQACEPLGPDYQAGLRRAFAERWVDIYANQGKRSGAYSSDVYGLHPYVLMNYDGSYREVSTLAHELGHSMHSFFSGAAQPFPTADYPIFLAEIASTFNENLLMQTLLKAETDDRLKLYLLDSYLEGLRGTLYRQTLFADFELQMHQQVEQGKSLTPDWLNRTYLDLTRLYYGHDQGVVKVEDYIQSEWSGIPHFHYNFYVYQYATGVIASMALADAVQGGGEAERERYLGFLRAGGSDDPLNTLKKAGVDMTKPETLSRAFQVFDRFVGEMEKLVARLAP